MTHEQLLALLNDMSPEEKAGQLTQIGLSLCAGGLSEPTGPMQEMQLTPSQVVLAGSLIGDGPSDPEETARVITEMTRLHPHHIPPVIMKDIIHGHRTIFPIPLAMGSTFDPGMNAQMAADEAEEASASGVQVTFAPMADVVRDPRWGRCMESAGESARLCGDMSAALVRGLHRNDDSALLSCAKHFAAYGLCQAGHEYAPVDVSRTELYNVYLPPFAAAIDAGVDMIMPSFIGIDRVPCVCNEWLLGAVLRDRLGFTGAVISDWADVSQLISHGIASDGEEATLYALRAGCDMDMMSNLYIRHAAPLAEKGMLSPETIDRSVLNILELKNRLGLLDDPLRGMSAQRQAAVCGRQDIREHAYEAAVRSCVLLKNEGSLPLRAGTRVYLAGDHADTGRLLGSWAADGDPAETMTLRQAFEERGVALSDLQHCDAVIYAVGEEQDTVGEDGSKAHISLTSAQMRELRSLACAGRPVIMVLFCGRPLVITDAVPYCDAVLNAWFPGTMGALAICDLLTGARDPSGHLSMTFPRAIGQIPIHHDRLSTCRPYAEGAIYCNRYRDEVNDPLYPFGYGLSYTRFAFDTATDGKSVTVTVRNTGDRAGETVVQLYGRACHAPFIRPDRQLIGYRRISLAPGAETSVTFTVTARDLAVYDSEGTLHECSGACLLGVGESGDVSLDIPFTL